MSVGVGVEQMCSPYVCVTWQVLHKRSCVCVWKRVGGLLHGYQMDNFQFDC